MTLLPQTQIEAYFRVVLTPHTIYQEKQLRTVYPRVYDEVLSYLLRLNNQPDKQGIVDGVGWSEHTEPGIDLCWQRLLLPNSEICSEIILAIAGRHVYLAYLALLPETFGLFAPAFIPRSISLIDDLLARTLQHVIDWAINKGACDITTTLYNPNLLNGFKRVGFKQTLRGPEIIGLPLPADYLRHL